MGMIDVPDELWHLRARSLSDEHARGVSQLCMRSPVPTTQTGLSPSKLALLLLFTQGAFKMFLKRSKNTPGHPQWTFNGDNY